MIPAATDTSNRRAEFLHLSRPSLGDEEVEEVLDSFRSGWLTTGPKVADFQERLSRYVGVPHVRCLSSCTAGLMLSLRIAGVGPGDEVLVPTLTFVSCANAIEHVGARPVFVDSDPETGLIDLDAAAQRIGPATRALMPVHLGGHPVDMERLNALRDAYGLVVVEDAAHAIGAEWGGLRIGAWGNFTSFSFHATKNITTFEGGALLVPNEEAATRVEQLSRHGLSRSAWNRHGAAAPDAYDVLEPGFKCAMHDVSAAVGLHQLNRLDGWIERRSELAAAYDEALADLPVAAPPHVPVGARHARHLYAVRLADDAGLCRDAVIEGLRRLNIGSSVHFRPIHTYSYYAERYGHQPEAFPVAHGLGRQLISLPLFPSMSADDVGDVAAALHRLLD